MTLLASVPATPYAVAIARRLGCRARIVHGWLHVYDAPPLTPGTRRSPRERNPEVGHIVARPEFEALNRDAAARQHEYHRPERVEWITT